MCLGVLLLGSNFFGPLWASWTYWKSISFTRSRKFSFINYPNNFSISCFLPPPSGTSIIWMLECLKLSWRLLSLSSFFFLHYCFFILFQLDAYCFLLLQIVDLSPSFLLFTVGSLYIFLFSLCVGFVSSFILWLSSTNFVSILITSVLNSAWDRLAISLLLSSFSGVLICSFIWAVFLCFSAPVTCKGQSLRYSPGLGNPFCWAVALSVREGSEKEHCHLHCSCSTLPNFPRFPQAVCDF